MNYQPTTALKAIHSAIEPVFGKIYDPCGSASIYDTIISKTLVPFLPSDAASERKFVQEVRDAARYMDRGREGPWTIYTYIAGCLDLWQANLCPGYAAARRYHNSNG